jgi:hypothetical protein
MSQLVLPAERIVPCSFSSCTLELVAALKESPSLSELRRALRSTSIGGDSVRAWLLRLWQNVVLSKLYLISIIYPPIRIGCTPGRKSLWRHSLDRTARHKH